MSIATSYGVTCSLRQLAVAAVLFSTSQMCARGQDPAPPADSSSANRAAVQPAYIRPTYIPETARQRWGEFVRYTFSPLSVVAAAASAGVGQWRDRPAEWREGGEGFAKRFGSAYGEHLVRATLLYGAASALHEDVRFTPLRAGSFGARLGHAITGTFAARHEDGTRHVSIARITAFAGAALISRAWQPRSTAGWESASASLAASASMAIGIDVFREFWPKKP